MSKPASKSTIRCSCVNYNWLQSLHIGYDHRRGVGYFQPAADDFLLCGRWRNLTSLTLNHLWCSAQSIDSLTSFLYSHANIEILHLDIVIRGGAHHNNANFVLPPNTLPHLRELKSNKEFVNAILECAADEPRPLETIKGVKLSGLDWDRAFFKNLKAIGEKLSKIELSGWNEMEDIRRLAECVPNLTWLDLGKRNNNTHKTTFASNVVCLIL